MGLLGVNIDHIATVRQARKGLEPDPVYAAAVCEQARADGIVVHLREDRRHINERDVYLLRKTVRTKLNLEMSAATEIVAIACDVKPHQATLVPERRQELTTEGGLDVVTNATKIKRTADTLKKNGIAVSLFIDPVKQQIDASKKTGVNMIELHTGLYSGSKTKPTRLKRLKEIQSAALYARQKGFRVFAGHGLDYVNVSDIAAIGTIEELNIGFSIVSRAVFVGLGQAVREMKQLIEMAYMG